MNIGKDYEEETYVVHDSKLGRTVAAVVDYRFRKIYVARAVCSKKDQFCRKIGRAIAIGRAVKILEGGRCASATDHTMVFPLREEHWKDQKACRAYVIDLLKHIIDADPDFSFVVGAMELLEM